jgi:hypothetical protein
MNQRIFKRGPISAPTLDPGVLGTAHGHSRTPTMLVDALEHAQTLLLQCRCILALYPENLW